jgi:hypothetical protein
MVGGPVSGDELMLRTLMMVMGILSSSVLLVECTALSWLWVRGSLTAQHLQEIRLILTEEGKTEGELQTVEAKLHAPSEQDIQNRRLLRVLDLESREKELDLMKAMTLNTENRLISDRTSFDNMREAFRNELGEMDTRSQSAAVEQARSVLLALLKSAPESAIERLMTLSLEEAVDLVRGMPEKSIAQLLREFDASTANDAAAQKERGQRIFEALNRGEPTRALIRNTLDGLPETSNGRSGSADG